jgi:hypothetical protein
MICSKCKNDKELTDFYKNKANKSGYDYYCKDCRRSPEVRKLANKANSTYRNKNKDNLEWRAQQNKTANKSYHKHKDKCLKRMSDYRTSGKRKKTRGSKDKEIWRRCAKERLKNPINRLHNAMRCGIRNTLQKNNLDKEGTKWLDCVDYSKEDLITHLESQFEEGMTWNNFGRYGWSIDHIIPISVFDIKDVQDISFKKCWALENLRPMWHVDNISKNATITEEAIILAKKLEVELQR